MPSKARARARRAAWARRHLRAAARRAVAVGVRGARAAVVRAAVATGGAPTLGLGVARLAGEEGEESDGLVAACCAELAAAALAVAARADGGARLVQFVLVLVGDFDDLDLTHLAEPQRASLVARIAEASGRSGPWLAMVPPSLLYVTTMTLSEICFSRCLCFKNNTT